MSKPLVAIIMGSDSDYTVMKEAEVCLQEFSIPFLKDIVSAHRTPDKMIEFARGASADGIKVIIAGAGGAAHLPGMTASLTALPVIGVPICATNMQGLDALLSIAQMPKGVPVATVAVDNAFNAGLLAAKILATSDEALLKKVGEYQETLRKKVEAKNI